jgi:hypothetical protein
VSYERELEMTADRLRQLPPARLQLGEADVPAGAAGDGPPPVPDIAPQAWGDQLWVIGIDVPEDRREGLLDDLVALRRAFDLLP